LLRATASSPSRSSNVTRRRERARLSRVLQAPKRDELEGILRRPRRLQRLKLIARTKEVIVTITDELLQNAEQYAAAFDQGDLPLPPAKRVAVLACMDARLNPYGLLGLKEGDAHVIRNAGGVVTDDEIRSLSISQRLLGTEEVILIHHTDCGMLTFEDADFRLHIQEETGIKPSWSAETFSNLEDDVRQSIARIRNSPFIPKKDQVRGFIYDVHTGRLEEVT